MEKRKGNEITNHQLRQTKHRKIDQIIQKQHQTSKQQLIHRINNHQNHSVLHNKRIQINKC